MKRLLIAMLALVMPLAGCAQREFAGLAQSPGPSTVGLTLPRVDTGNDFELVAPQDGLLIVYFGYTSCPDICPTTMQDVTAALRRLNHPASVQVAMVTVDPDRDIPVLQNYVRSFVEDGVALGTTDDSRLARAAQIFGASYLVSTNDSGEVEVAHSTALYVVDDAGTLLLTWQFGTASRDIADDLEDLLDGRRP